MGLSNLEKLGAIARAGVLVDERGAIRDGEGHPTGRSHAAKRCRIPFSKEDDDSLADWVAKAEEQGLPARIRIFEDLATINARHTSQSWQARWKKLRRETTPSETTSPASTTYLSSPSESTGATTRPAAQPSSPSLLAHTTLPPASPPAPSLQPPPRNQPHVSHEADLPRKDGLISQSPHSAPPSSDGHNEGGEGAGRVPASLDGDDDPWHLPEVPSYAVAQSRIVSGQMKALEWLTAAGRRRFKMQEEMALARWGVTTQHSGTCVLVPHLWSSLDGAAVLSQFDYETYMHLDDARLVYSMLDHSTPWTRAATWFQSWPRTGVELDNFLGAGPFQPMEGSHLCHHGNCISAAHAVYESAEVNESRKVCANTARDLREHGLLIPKHCTRHKEPPCLLQHAALTTLEAYLIQLSVLRQARGLVGPPRVVRRPADHRFSTFETRLPVSFAASAIIARPEDLCRGNPAEVPHVNTAPAFHCNYCRVVTTFKTLPGYWAHLRDGHPLVSERHRLEDMVRAGETWQEHKRQSSEVDDGDVTWKQVEQMRAASFDWDVVLGWKLAYSRKRKYGKSPAFYDDDGSPDAEPMNEEHHFATDPDT